METFPSFFWIELLRFIDFTEIWKLCVLNSRFNKKIQSIFTENLFFIDHNLNQIRWFYHLQKVLLNKTKFIVEEQPLKKEIDHYIPDNITGVLKCLDEKGNVIDYLKPNVVCSNQIYNFQPKKSNFSNGKAHTVTGVFYKSWETESLIIVQVDNNSSQGLYFRLPKECIPFFHPNTECRLYTPSKCKIWVAKVYCRIDLKIVSRFVCIFHHECDANTKQINFDYEPFGLKTDFPMDIKHIWNTCSFDFIWDDLFISATIVSVDFFLNLKLRKSIENIEMTQYNNITFCFYHKQTNTFRIAKYDYTYSQNVDIFLAFPIFGNNIFYFPEIDVIAFPNEGNDCQNNMDKIWSIAEIKEISNYMAIPFINGFVCLNDTNVKWLQFQ